MYMIALLYITFISYTTAPLEMYVWMIQTSHRTGVTLPVQVALAQLKEVEGYHPNSPSDSMLCPVAIFSLFH